MPEQRKARRLRLSWVLCAIAVALVATCPALVSDPAVWAYLLDPELLLLLLVLGVQGVREQLGPVLLRSKLRFRRGIALRTPER
jgi:hypothetical protein